MSHPQTNAAANPTVRLRIFLLLTLFLASVLIRSDASTISPRAYFGIQVVDEQTGRGVPLVELKTTSNICYYTDSNGLIAFYEPGLMNRDVWFGVSSHGYEFPEDGFGERGVRLKTTLGKIIKIKIKRLNIAERLYRITGQGIYRDTVMLGRKPPIAEPLLNAEVTGQDTVHTAVYRGKLWWFYGDTTRAAYALGNFSTSGAVTRSPAKIDPSIGFDLHYFTGKNGFVRAMAPLPGEGAVWLDGVVVLPDETGRARMLAWYQRRHGLDDLLENGFVCYNDDHEKFEKLQSLPLNPPVYPQANPFRAVGENGVEYIYFSAPYPQLRVKADWKSYLDLSSYETYTCLKPGASQGDTNQPQLDRDAHGKLNWHWRKNLPPFDQREQQKLITAGKMTREESPFRLHDDASGKPILINSCSCFWNNFRQCYIMIASEFSGDTLLGEIWYAGSAHPEGPWTGARKIITHGNKPGDAHDFYNPTQHPFFDQDGGRVIYLEGTYVNTFSGNPHTTPWYEYNQIMYRLDLSDPRLKFPSEQSEKLQK